MVAVHPPLPNKPFREEAKAGSIQCLACGGPITLHGFGATLRVVCPYCGSELSPEQSGELALVQAQSRKRKTSLLPLHQRGHLDGAPWEIIGIVWRQCTVAGTTYHWQEFLLFNPYLGYRFLIYSMSDGHWSLGTPLDVLPRARSRFGRKSIAVRGDSYRHFQSVEATVTYVEGEFPWEVHVGDKAASHEYVRPPFSVNIEEEHGEGGADINFTHLRYIEPKVVWRAFECPGSPPRTYGIASNQPNPWDRGRGTTWLAMVLLLIVWGVAGGLYASDVSTRTVFQEELSATQWSSQQPISQIVEIGTPGEATTLEFSLAAPGLSNAWAFAEVLLVAQDREAAYAFGITAEEWHGVTDGESWQEGSRYPSEVFGGIPGGAYLVQITPSAGGATSTNGTPSPLPSDMPISFSMREDVFLLRYAFLPFLVIVGIPILFGLFRLSYEHGRWKNSDYASND